MKRDKPDPTQLIPAIRAILWNDWDPIGVNDLSPEDDEHDSPAYGEYDSYGPRIAGMLLHGVNHVRLSQHLHEIETKLMGLRGNPAACDQIAKKLTALVSAPGQSASGGQH